MRSFIDSVNNHSAINRHTQGPALCGVGHAADEQSTGFHLPEKEAGKQIQGHAKGREVNAK